MYFFWKFIFWIVLWISIFIVNFIAPEITNSQTLKTVLFVLGLIFVSYGLILNAVAGKTLKKFAHFDIKKGINKPDKMIDLGIFSCMRHPAMFGSIFFSIGIAMLQGKIITLLWAGWVSFAALYFIMAVEERETIEQFGNTYCNFIKEKKPFSFSLACLVKGIKILKNHENTEKQDIPYR